MKLYKQFPSKATNCIAWVPSIHQWVQSNIIVDREL